MFETVNHIEAGLWIVIGIAFAGYAIIQPRARRRASAAAIVFVLFGVSDIVEAQTGAWWRPWWLLCWKAVCILTMLILFLRHKMGRIATENLGDAATAFARIANPQTASIEITCDTFCKSCGYNLRGLTGRGNCPECGTTIQLTLAARNSFQIRGEHLLWTSYAVYFGTLIWSFWAGELIGRWAEIPVYICLGIAAPAILALSAITMLFAGPKTRGANAYLYILALAITGFLYVQACYAAIASV